MFISQSSLDRNQQTLNNMVLDIDSDEDVDIND